MPTEPAASVSHNRGRDQAAYRAAVQQAVAAGPLLMGKLVVAARQALQASEAASKDLRQRDAYAESANQLRLHEPQLCKVYPDALLRAFNGASESKKSTAVSVADVQFDQLELMDETQVLTSVTLARVQQAATLAVEASLAELNTLISSVLGLTTVRPDLNMLRPESYIQALKEVLEQTQASPAMQIQWFNAMAATLGKELRAQYVALCAQLRKEGYVAVTYARPSRGGGGSAAPAGFGSQVTGSGNDYTGAYAGGNADYGGPTAYAVQSGSAGQASGGGHAAASPAPKVQARDASLLTLDKLRRLLSGELAPEQQVNRVDQFAAQFSSQFEDAGATDTGSNTDFDSTFPAALEALTEMKQVERVVRSLEQRQSAASDRSRPNEHSIEGQRRLLRASAKDMAQALSLEVVTLMVDNMAHDARLLDPVRQVIRDLEPALLRLALVDPRFFTDKQHPARRLLQEVTHHSLAFESPSAAGFEIFLRGLQAALEPLSRAPVENADVFEETLVSLQQEWSHSTRATEKDRDSAVEVLKHAEARNLLAEKVAQGIEALPDSARVPAFVREFLCGPWSQVVAQARIKHGAGSTEAEKFESLIPALLWSAHPELARTSPAKLTRLVPRLVGTLRDGLDTISYPAARTGEFLESLMTVHQQAMRPKQTAAAASATAQPSEPLSPSERVHLEEDGNPWIAPQEAAASNFVDIAEVPALTQAPATPQLPNAELVAPLPPLTLQDSDLPLGSWVELMVNDTWVRTQLTWASPHGTLFLFTGVFGNTQSMSRRSRDKLVAAGKLRLISGHPFVDGALDAVAQTAMRNSVDSAT